MKEAQKIMTIHYLQYGHTPCMMEGVPMDWPAGHAWSNEWSDVNCPHCLRGKNIAPTFSIDAEGKSITCLRCKTTSHNPNDVANHYCGRCHVNHDDIWPPARLWWVEHPDPVPVPSHGKTYSGERRPEGPVVWWRVGPEATILDPRPSRQLHNHSPDGFEWGYGGAGPAQLALAILLDYFITCVPLHFAVDPCELAQRYYQHFKQGVIAALPAKWTITQDQIGAWLATQNPNPETRND